MRKKQLWGLFGTCLALFCVDFLSKLYTYRYIPPMHWASPYPYGGIPVFHDWMGVDFSLNYVTNTGAAWGALSQFQIPLLYARCVIILGFMAYLFFSCLSGFKKTALSLILTGTIGNVVDFFLYHHVVDMFHFVFWRYSFPVFNIADTTIFCGVVLLLIEGVLSSYKKKDA